LEKLVKHFLKEERGKSKEYLKRLKARQILVYKVKWDRIHWKKRERKKGKEISAS